VGYCNGVELYFAIKSLGCQIQIESGYVIPFNSKSKRGRAEEEKAEEMEMLKLIKGGKGASDRVEEPEERKKDYRDAANLLKEWIGDSSKKKKKVKSIANKSLFDKIRDSLKFEWLTVIGAESVPSAVEGVRLNDTDCVPVEGLGTSVEGLSTGPNEVDKGKRAKYDESHGFEAAEFFRVIDALLLKRNSYKPGTYSNLLYKFIGNAGIGAMGRGLNHKMV
jgi:hypothetical protein